MSGALTLGLVGVGNMNQSTVVAVTGVGGTDMPDESAALTVNLSGAFFQETASQQVATLLHEIAHMTGAADFLSGDNNTAAQNFNNTLVQQNCQTTLNVFDGN